jgi:Zn finger protein HypA/HybF involved in hydrogenase expression
MPDIIDLTEHRPHSVSEIMCVKCYKRYIGVVPAGTLLKDLECPQCHEAGYAIRTGEIIKDETD